MWQVDIHLRGIPLTFKLDAGAVVSVIPLAVYESLHHKPVLKQTQHCLVSTSSDSLDILGYFSANLVDQSAVPVSTDLYVVRTLRHSLLSCSDSECLGLAKRLFETRTCLAKTWRLSFMMACSRTRTAPWLAATPARQNF